jgi:hypothetical protein
VQWVSLCSAFHNITHISALHVFLPLFTCSLLAGVPVVYSGDPLRDLGTTAFLDKFVNKKPKVGACGLCLWLVGQLPWLLCLVMVRVVVQ